MKELDRKEMKSKSLIANILDMDDDYHPATKSHTVHPSHPNYPKTPLASIFMSRSNPNLANSFEETVAATVAQLAGATSTIARLEGQESVTSDENKRLKAAKKKSERSSAILATLQPEGEAALYQG